MDGARVITLGNIKKGNLSNGRFFYLTVVKPCFLYLKIHFRDISEREELRGRKKTTNRLLIF
jgi:hypothetical protein